MEMWRKIPIDVFEGFRGLCEENYCWVLWISVGRVLCCSKFE